MRRRVLIPKFQKGLQLCEGGVLRLFGNKGAPAGLRRLRAPAR